MNLLGEHPVRASSFRCSCEWLNRNAPLAAVAGIALGKPGMIFIMVVTILSILGSLSGAVLSIPRILFAGARDGLLPASLAKVHPRFATPHVAILVYTGIDFIMAVSGGFRQLAVIASASSLILYLGVILAVVKLRRKKTYTETSGFRMPGGITVPLIATITIIWMLSNLTRTELTGISISIGACSVIYLLMTILKKKKYHSRKMISPDR